MAAHLERAIALRGDYALAHLNLGNVRREQGRLAEAVACYERALALSPNSPAARFNLANMLSEQQRFDAAAANYRQVLALEPNHAEAHGGLGAALSGARAAARGHHAISSGRLALKPDLAGAYEELAKAYMSAGNVAIRRLGRRPTPLELNETRCRQGPVRAMRDLCQFHLDPDGRFRKLVQRALVEAWAVPRELSGVCISLIKLDAADQRNDRARRSSYGPNGSPQRKFSNSPAMAALADDELLRSFWNAIPITDIGLERLIANVRYALLFALTAEDAKHCRSWMSACSIFAAPSRGSVLSISTCSR